MDKILFTFPGKLGDLLYTLPIIKEYHKLTGHDISILTSEYCRPAIPLLISQPYIKNALIDDSYVCLSNMCGMQPPELRELKGYDKIFQLGFRRDIIGSPLSYLHIVNSFEATMKIRYGINLNHWDHDDKYIHVEDATTQNYIVFNNYGHAFYMAFKTHGPGHTRLIGLWHDLFHLIKKNTLTKILIITGPDEVKYHEEHFKDIGKIYVPKDLLDAASVIAKASMFIGLPSCPYVLADGLKIPRLTIGVYRHILPLGPNGYVFQLANDAEYLFQQVRPFCLPEPPCVSHPSP